MYKNATPCWSRYQSSSEDAKAMYLSLLFGFILVLTSFAMTLAPRAGNKVAVFTNPWAINNSAFMTIAKADANVAADGNTNWIAIAVDNKQGLTTRLYKAGAILVIDATFLISCGILPR